VTGQGVAEAGDGSWQVEAKGRDCKDLSQGTAGKVQRVWDNMQKWALTVAGF
jgi:hypothetical protein